jgi:hypothetical protein
MIRFKQLWTPTGDDWYSPDAEVQKCAFVVILGRGFELWRYNKFTTLKQLGEPAP